uniref:Uncharacterized protein n=1 Tax=uncultured marine thaumarchaeote KM3_84_E02 TaxID=1456312 RepID=A0A075HSJ8_9ARCH|nr:hypothetical protein [uncultured marine thaumarchaeote KM3_84_E02]
MNFKKIILYNEPSISEIDIEQLTCFLETRFPIQVEVRENIFKQFNDEQIKRLSSIRVRDVKNSFSIYEYTVDEIEFEKKLSQDSSLMDSTTKVEDAVDISEVYMYDGFELQKILRYLNEDKEVLHIIITNRLTCTFDENDNRYHARAAICANPAIISTTGIIEAPAKPREYYFEVMALKSQGLGIESAKEQYKNRFLEYNDKRLTKVLEGYILQIIFYNITGESFCEDIQCRLNNAHWQKDLLFSQIEISKLCKKHSEILENLN